MTIEDPGPRLNRREDLLPVCNWQFRSGCDRQLQIGSLAARGIAVLLWCSFFMATPLEAQIVTNSTSRSSLRLKDFLQLVLQRNESVQLRVLELEITKRKFK